MVNPISLIGSLTDSSTLTKLAGTASSAASVASSAASVASSAASVGSDFSNVLASVSRGFVDSMKNGEGAAISGVTGNVPVAKAVQAIMVAEESLQTAIAVRDKVVAAYQEVTRMSI